MTSNSDFFQGEIEFKNYSLQYREGEPLILKDLTFRVKGGEKIGIIGRTGAGKSSLINGLFRMIEPSQGTVTIDGFDICKMGLHDLRQKLNIVPQDPVMYSGTLRQNMDPTNSLDDEKIIASISDSGLLSYFENFASQSDSILDFPIAENGSNLSLGEKQIVCLVRAMLKHSKIVVFDEATSAIDTATDRIIQKTLRKICAKSTVLTIAHRINTIIDYDRILVLEKGAVREFDTPKVLFNRKDSIFRTMCLESELTPI